MTSSQRAQVIEALLNDHPEENRNLEEARKRVLNRLAIIEREREKYLLTAAQNHLDMRRRTAVVNKLWEE